MNYKILYKILILLLLPFISTACTKTQNLDEEDTKYGFLIAESGDITVPLTPFDSLDPTTTENMSFFYLSNLVYDGIYTLDKNYKPIFALGASEKVEGKSIVVTLKDGVSFHDGSLLKSADVKYSLEHIINGKKGAYYSLISDSFTGKPALLCEVIDQKTIRFTWTGNGPMLKEYLIFPVIKPPTDKNTMPVGTGPFKFESYDPKKILVLEKYKFYHDESPSISRVIGLVHDDEELIFTSLNTGRINVSTSWSKDFSRFYNNDKLKANVFPSDKLHFLFLNPNGVFADKKLRIGLYNVIDKEAMIREALADRGVKTNSFINPRNYMYENRNDEINLERAIEILSNKPVNITIYFDWGNKADLSIANYINKQLTDIGVKVNIVANEQDTFEDYLRKITEGNYDLLISTAKLNMIPDYMINLLTNHYFPFENDTMNSYREAYKSLNNNDDLNKLIGEMDEYLSNEKVFIPLAFEENALIYKNTIIGEFAPNNIFPYRDLRSAYFTQQVNEEDLETKNEKETK